MTTQDLVTLDSTFSKKVNNTNINEWVNTFSNDGFMLGKSGTPIKGHNTIKDVMTPFFKLKSLEFSWQPEGGSLSDDCTLGYTYGTYSRSWLDDSNHKITETGRYVTIWRQQIDGSYLIEMDMGN